MKMGTIRSLWRYDAATADAIRLDNQRRTAILRYASWANVLPTSRVVRSPFDFSQFNQPSERRDGPETEILIPQFASSPESFAVVWTVGPRLPNRSLVN